MKHSSARRCGLALLALVFFSSLGSASGWSLSEPFDHSLFDQFLKKYVDAEGFVDYAAAQKDRALLDEYLRKMESQDPIDFKTWPREERLAFWLNAYHAALIRTVLDHYPIKSLLDIPGVSDIVVFKMNELQRSFNQIRKVELIGGFHDEKIHLAISCGAVTCPPLQAEAFTGPRVEGQLFVLTKKFVNNTALNRIDIEKKQVLASEIFKWYAEDFIMDFGLPESTLKFPPGQIATLSFLAYYLDDTDLAEFLEAGDYKIKYLRFDWTLNDRALRPAAPAVVS
ncbi:MAG: DUF547 domain-containing protein [Candidatus Omnitrophota bacterium]